MRKLGVAVVGVGKLGKRHAENLKWRIPEAQLVAVSDTNNEVALQVAKELEVKHSYNSLNSVLERKDVDAIVIATPSKFHAQEIEAAAQAGKHVFSEKPTALTPEEARTSLAAVERGGVALQVGFMRRYDPAYVAAKKRIDAGEIGDPIMFKSLSRDAQPPPPSFFRGGVNGTLLSDAAIHDFDLARWMMNDEVIETHTYAGLLACPELAEFGDMDTCLVNIKFKRGGIGNVEAFRKAIYGYDIRTEIVGTLGTIQVGYLQATHTIALTRSGPSFETIDHWLTRFADAYLNELVDFVRVVASGKTPRVTGEQGLRGLEIAAAAERSYREARPITVACEKSPRTEVRR